MNGRAHKLLTDACNHANKALAELHEAAYIDSRCRPIYDKLSGVLDILCDEWSKSCDEREKRGSL